MRRGTCRPALSSLFQRHQTIARKPRRRHRLARWTWRTRPPKYRMSQPPHLKDAPRTLLGTPPPAACFPASPRGATPGVLLPTASYLPVFVRTGAFGERVIAPRIGGATVAVRYVRHYLRPKLIRLGAFGERVLVQRRFELKFFGRLSAPLVPAAVVAGHGLVPQ